MKQPNGSLTRLTLRPGRLAFALALAGVLLATGPAAPPAPAAMAAPGAALVCKMQPTRLGRKCFCYGRYGWKIAPAILCRVTK